MSTNRYIVAVILAIIFSIVIVLGFLNRAEPMAVQQDAEYYQCSPTVVKICAVGSGPPAGCEFVGTGQSDANLVEDC